MLRLWQGHLARDCWQNSQVRNVAESMPGSTNVQGCPTSSVGGFSSSSQMPGSQQPPLSSASTQIKVSRIQEVNEDVEDGDLIFDMRSSSPCSCSGAVHVVYHTLVILVMIAVVMSASVAAFEQ